jgi:hypothetical protein
MRAVAEFNLQVRISAIESPSGAAQTAKRLLGPEMALLCIKPAVCFDCGRNRKYVNLGTIAVS